MPDALFGFLDLDSAKVAQFVIRCLAVGGGFLAGFLITWLLTYFIDRWLTGGKSPEIFHRAARVLGGLAVAILVALIVFGQGGEGYGLGGGPSEGKGQGTEQKTDGTGDPTKQTYPTAADGKATEPIASKDAVPPEQRVRVTLLGGDDVKDERFYLIDDDRTPRNLVEVTTAVKTKKETSAKAVGVEVRFAPNNTLPRNHPAVLRLTNWAQGNGVTVSFPAGPS